MAPQAAPERETPTVKQVTSPTHGGTRNRAPRRAFLHRVPRRLVDGVQPAPGWGVACSNAGHARAASSRHRAGPRTEPCRHAAEVLSLRRLFRSDRTARVSNHAACRGDSAMTARDGLNKLPSAGTIPHGVNGAKRSPIFGTIRCPTFSALRCPCFGTTGDSNVGGYPSAALLSSSFIGALRTPALRLVLSR